MTMMKFRRSVLFLLLALICLWPIPMSAGDPGFSSGDAPQLSDHFDGNLYFNLDEPPPPPVEQAPQRSHSSWIWRWVFGTGWTEWPVVKGPSPGPPPVDRVPKGELLVTPVGHATFLIQIDGVNLLTDPIWSERCSPVSWAGPRRHREAGIRFEDLPPIDAVLISHNHYDHLDLPTLERLAQKGTPRAVVTLGNRELVRGSGIRSVEALDWWQSVPLAPEVRVTLTPVQHFSSRTLWDRNRTLWGGFVVSGPSGHVFFAGDTGYGPHFGEIARRFPGIRAALLPISPFQPRESDEPPGMHHMSVHMGPAEAVRAKLDLGAEVGIASHFQVFQLGGDGFEDAVNELALVLKSRDLSPGAFIAPALGLAIEVGARPKGADGLASLERAGICR
jgi:L-ascorbate metabolism protein UlaG (beta-lactamase superfamily)